MTDSQKWLTLVLIAGCGFLTYLLAPILMPFLVSFLLAYLGSPLVERLTHWKVPRLLSVCIVFLMITVALLLMIAGLVSGVRDQVAYLNTKLPDFIAWTTTQAIPWIEKTSHMDLRHLNVAELTGLLSNSWQEAGAVAGQILSHVALSGMNIVGFLASVALIPVVTFYLMVDWQRLIHHCDDLLPRQIQGRVTGLMKECNEVVGAFFRGQFLVMICLSFVYILGLKIVGLEIAVTVGLIAGLGSIIPYFGFTIGIILATVAALFQFQEFLPILWVWTVFGIGQIIESWVLIPYLVGNKVGLHPVMVIFAILAGGQLFGFFGMLLAIPAMAVIVVLLRHAKRHYVESELYMAEPDSSVIHKSEL